MELFKPDELSLGTAVSKLQAEIHSLGIADIRVSKEVAELEVAANQAGKANFVGEHFRRTLNTFAPDHVLWIGLYDENDRCVVTCGSRLDYASGWSLQHLIQQYFERVFQSEDGEPVSLSKASVSCVSTFTGKSVYVGEGHVNKGYRGRNLLALAQRLLIISAYVRWDPELIYGFMRPDKIFNNYHLDWGYSVAKPTAIIWEKPPAEASLHDLYFVGLGVEGVRRLCSDPLLVGLSRSRESSRTESLHREGFAVGQ